MCSASDLDTWVHSFCERVQDLRIIGPERYQLRTLLEHQPGESKKWAERSGIYFFEQDGTVQYVGRALWRTGLLGRILDHCQPRGDVAWDALWTHENTSVGVVALEPADWYWAGALEPYLITHCAPRFNKRVC